MQPQAQVDEVAAEWSTILWGTRYAVREWILLSNGQT